MATYNADTSRGWANNMNIIGVMRLCNEFVDEVELTIGSLAAFCTGVCFVVDAVTDTRVLRAIDNCQNVLGSEDYRRQDGDWYDREQMDQCYQLANRFNPDWILMPDQDELLPYPQLRRMLEDYTAQDLECAFLPPLQCWETPYRIVHPQLNTMQPHCRIYRGRLPNFTTITGSGCGAPANMTRFCYTAFPMRHMSFMTAHCRDIRARITDWRNRLPPWLGDHESEPSTVAFRPDWDVNDWHRLPLHELSESQV